MNFSLLSFKNIIAGALFASASFATSAFAFPVVKVTVRNATLTDRVYSFEGIVALEDCSGSIVQFEGADSSSQAYVLTNGHCLDAEMPHYNQVISHLVSTRNFAVLDQNALQVGIINSTQVVYATMTNTDIALYKVKETYSDILKNWGVHPFIISQTHPLVGSFIEVISGYWARGYSCQIESFSHELHEDEWIFKDSIRYSRPGCETIGGTSGSPVIEAGTRKIIGINNTVNEEGGQCTIDNPCEIDEAGKVTFEKGLAYGQQIYMLYTCLNDKKEFDFETSGCALPHSSILLRGHSDD